MALSISFWLRRRTLHRLGVLASGYTLIAWQSVLPQAWDSMMLVGSLILGVALIGLTVADLETMRLPDRVTLPLAAAGVLMQVRSGWPGPMEAALAAVLGFLSLHLVGRGFERWRGHAGLGGGDAKLFGAGGAWVGLSGSLMVLLLASVSGLVAAGVARLAGFSIDRRTRLPFGPFLAVSIWLVWLVGAEEIAALIERRF